MEITAKDEEVKSTMRQFLKTWMTAWNEGKDAKLRTVMHFPFVSFGGGPSVLINNNPEDFSELVGREITEWEDLTFKELRYYTSREDCHRGENCEIFFHYSRNYEKNVKN